MCLAKKRNYEDIRISKHLALFVPVSVKNETHLNKIKYVYKKADVLRVNTITMITNNISMIIISIIINDRWGGGGSRSTGTFHGLNFQKKLLSNSEY